MRPLPHFALDPETASRLALRLVRAFLIAVVVLAATRVHAAQLASTADGQYRGGFETRVHNP